MAAERLASRFRITVGNLARWPCAQTRRGVCLRRSDWRTTVQPTLNANATRKPSSEWTVSARGEAARHAGADRHRRVRPHSARARYAARPSCPRRAARCCSVDESSVSGMPGFVKVRKTTSLGRVRKGMAGIQGAARCRQLVERSRCRRMRHSTSIPAPALARHAVGELEDVDAPQRGRRIVQATYSIRTRCTIDRQLLRDC